MYNRQVPSPKVKFWIYIQASLNQATHIQQARWRLSRSACQSLFLQQILRLTIFSQQRSNAVFLQTILVEIHAEKVSSSLNM